MDDALYREEILDHYRSSAHRGQIDRPDLAAELQNPLCGDVIRLQVELEPDRKTIRRVRFDGHGCALSQAGASMLAGEMEGHTLVQARRFTSEEMLGLLGAKLTPTRIKCWLLGWRALQHAIPADVQGG